MRIQQVNGSSDGKADVTAGVEDLVAQGEVGQDLGRGLVYLCDGVNHRLGQEERLHIQPIKGHLREKHSLGLDTRSHGRTYPLQVRGP